MKTRHLGSSALVVSELGFGCMGLNSVHSEPLEHVALVCQLQMDVHSHQPPTLQTDKAAVTKATAVSEDAEDGRRLESPPAALVTPPPSEGSSGCTA